VADAFDTTVGKALITISVTFSIPVAGVADDTIRILYAVPLGTSVGNSIVRVPEAFETTEPISVEEVKSPVGSES
jgi:hypothetical protein